MIGRTPCPECGFQSAHVKQSEKCLYRYCPECQAQYNTRTERQRADLTAKTRLTEPPATTPSSSSGELPPAPATASATPDADPASATAPSASGSAVEEPTPKPKRRGLF